MKVKKVIIKCLLFLLVSFFLMHCTKNSASSQNNSLNKTPHLIGAEPLNSNYIQLGGSIQKVKK